MLAQHTRPADLQPDDHYTLLVNSAIRDQLLTKLDFDATSEANAVSLPERGWKARVIMWSPSTLVALLHVCQKRVISAMQNDPALMQVLNVEHDGAVKSRFPFLLSGPRQLLSVNLATATDLLPQDLVKAVWEGLV